MMEAKISSETWINIYNVAWCNITEDSDLYTRHRENLKSQHLYPLNYAMSESVSWSSKMTDPTSDHRGRPARTETTRLTAKTAR